MAPALKKRLRDAGKKVGFGDPMRDFDSSQRLKADVQS